MQFLKRFYVKHPILANFLMIIIVGWLMIWAVLIFLDHWTMHGSTAVVPEIKNRSFASAREILRANNLEIEISDSIYDRTAAPGTVIESWPKAGAVVKEGRQVYVTVTAFSPKQITVSMPLTNSVSVRQAMSYLRGIGLTDIRVVYVPSEYPDLVVGAYYGDTPLSVGAVIPVTSTITLEVGSAPTAPEEEIGEDGMETAPEQVETSDASAEIYG